MQLLGNLNFLCLVFILVNLNLVKTYRISKIEIWDDSDKNVKHPEPLQRYDENLHDHNVLAIKDLIDFVPKSEKLLKAIHEMHDVLPQVSINISYMIMK